MNSSNFVHAGLAVMIQVGVGIATGNWLYGALVAGGIFWGREHAQKQNNIAREKMCLVKDLKWWEGGDMTKWSKDSLLDFFTPLCANILVLIIATQLV